MLDQEVGVDSVHGGHVHQAAPANIVAGAVVLDVHGAEVTGLPVVELEQVDTLQDDRYHHGAGDMAEHLILLEGVADDAHLPVHQAEAAVGELLHIETEDAGIELSAPEEINDQASVSTRIFGGREGQAFDGEHGAEAESKNVQGRQNITHLIVHLSGSNDAIVSQGKHRNDRDKIALHTVGVIHRNMTGRRGGGLEDLAGYILHENKLKRHERQNHLPRKRVKRGRPDLNKELKDALLHSGSTNGRD